MSEGGTLKDSLHGFWKGIKRLVRIGHNDQRASWLAHLLICWSATGAVGAIGLIFHMPLLFAGWASLGMLLYFTVREVGDAYAHRKRGDWNHQQDGRGSISARYDAWGDICGPISVCATTWLMVLLSR